MKEKEYYTLAECREILGLNESDFQARRQLENEGLKAVVVYSAAAVDSLAADLLEVEELPENVCTLTELVKEFPELTAGVPDRGKCGVLLRRVPGLRDVGELVRVRGRVKSKNVYLRQKARRLCASMREKYEKEKIPPEYIGSAEAYEIIGKDYAWGVQHPAYYVRLMARQQRLEMRILHRKSIGRGRGQRVFFHVEDVKKLSELVKKGGENE